MCDWLKKFFRKKPPAPLTKRKIVDTESVRTRMSKQGWSLKELLIRRKDASKNQWKVIAFKGFQSVEATGATIDDAIQNVGKLLGVISRKE
jgi:hypothetical protein